jgi:hypothetical protein
VAWETCTKTAGSGECVLVYTALTAIFDWSFEGTLAQADDAATGRHLLTLAGALTLNRAHTAQGGGTATGLVLCAEAALACEPPPCTVALAPQGDGATTGLDLHPNVELGAGCAADAEITHLGACPLACAGGYTASGEQPFCDGGALRHATDNLLCAPNACAIGSVALPAHGFVGGPPPAATLPAPRADEIPCNALRTMSEVLSWI